MNIRTPVGKRIKLVVMDFSYALPEDEHIRNDYEYMFDEDIRIIGFTINAHWGISGTPAFKEGRVDLNVHLTRAGGDVPTGSNKQLGRVSCQSKFWTEIVVADQLAGQFSESPQHMEVMFPEGHGIDFDENERMYLLTLGYQNMSVANMSFSGWANIYYVER